MEGQHGSTPANKSPEDSGVSKHRKRSRSPGCREVLHQVEGAPASSHGAARAGSSSAVHNIATAAASVQDQGTPPDTKGFKLQGAGDSKRGYARSKTLAGPHLQDAALRETGSPAMLAGPVTHQAPGSAPPASRAPALHSGTPEVAGALNSKHLAQQIHTPHRGQQQNPQQQWSPGGELVSAISPAGFSRRSTPAQGGSLGISHDMSAADTGAFNFPPRKRRSSVEPIDMYSDRMHAQLLGLLQTPAGLAPGGPEAAARTEDPSGDAVKPPARIQPGGGGNVYGDAETGGQEGSTPPARTGSVRMEEDSPGEHASGAGRSPSGGPSPPSVVAPLPLPLPRLQKRLSPRQVEAALTEVAEATRHKPRGRPVKHITVGINRLAMKFHVGLQLGDRVESVGGCDTHEAAAMLQDLTYIGLGLYPHAAKAAAPHPSTHPVEQTVLSLTFPASCYHSAQVQRVVAQLINRRLLPEGELALSHARAAAAGCSIRPMATNLLQALLPTPVGLRAEPPSSSTDPIGGSHRQAPQKQASVGQLSLMGNSHQLDKGQQHSPAQLGRCSSVLNVAAGTLAPAGSTAASGRQVPAAQGLASQDPAVTFSSATATLPRSQRAPAPPLAAAPPQLAPSAGAQAQLLARSCSTSAPPGVLNTSGAAGAGLLRSSTTEALGTSAPLRSSDPALAPSSSCTAGSVAGAGAGGTAPTSRPSPPLPEAPPSPTLWELMQGAGGQQVLHTIPIDGTNKAVTILAPASVGNPPAAASARQQYQDGAPPQQVQQPVTQAAPAPQPASQQPETVLHSLGQAMLNLSVAQQQQNQLRSQQQHQDQAAHASSAPHLHQLRHSSQPSLGLISGHVAGAGARTFRAQLSELPDTAPLVQAQPLGSQVVPAQPGGFQPQALEPAASQFITQSGFLRMPGGKPFSGDVAAVSAGVPAPPTALFVQPDGALASLQPGMLAPVQEPLTQPIFQQLPQPQMRQQAPPLGAAQVVGGAQGPLVLVDASGQLVSVLQPAVAAAPPQPALPTAAGGHLSSLVWPQAQVPQVQQSFQQQQQLFLSPLQYPSHQIAGQGMQPPQLVQQLPTAVPSAQAQLLQLQQQQQQQQQALQQLQAQQQLLATLYLQPPHFG